MSTLSRLVSMDTREIVYRLQEKLRSETERFRHYAGVDAETGADALEDFKGYLSAKAAPHFYFLTTGLARERRLEAIRSRFPRWIEDAVEAAERACLHRVSLLGFAEVDLGGEIDWHRDPFTGRAWAKGFWADYDLVHDSAAGDPKVIHELNRHQHIVALAKAYFLKGDERYALEAVSQLESWIEQNPPAVGINWQSSLEIGIRAIGWLWSLFLLLPSQALTAAAASRIGRSLVAQIEHIDRFPSLFSSPNTHLIGEATALFVAGTVLEGLKESSRWQRNGVALLTREVGKQVLVDGMHGELSSYYHCYTADFLLQAVTLGDRNGFRFPEWLDHRLERMLAFAHDFVRCNGTLPLVGDDDGGRALGIVGRNYRSPRFDEEIFWLEGEGGRLPRSVPGNRQLLYPAAGYVIQRSGSGSEDSRVLFDCGSLGMLNGGHGHADALSLVLNVGPTEVLIDPGTCVYNGAPQWRDYFRSTRAHNTVVVDDGDQSIPSGTFKWQRRAECRVLHHLSNEAFDYVEAEHDGYQQPPRRVMHRRSVFHVRPGLWVIADSLRGPPQEHTFEFLYHLPAHAKLHLRDESECIVRADARVTPAHLQLLMCASAPIEAKTIEGETAPIQGWVSSLYGERVPAPVLSMTMRSRAPAASLTLLAPSCVEASEERPAVTRAVTSAQGDALACEAVRGKIRDLFVFPLRDQPVVIMNFTLQGKFFWLRRTAGRLTQVLGIDCKEILHGDEVLLRNPKAGTFARGLDPR